MLDKKNLLYLLRKEPEKQIEVSVDDLADANIDWVEISELATRNAYVTKKLTKTPDSGLTFRDDRVVFLRKSENT